MLLRKRESRYSNYWRGVHGNRVDFRKHSVSWPKRSSVGKASAICRWRSKSEDRSGGGNYPHRHVWTKRASSSVFGASVRTRSEEHTSELQSLMRNSYAVFCLKKKT